MWRGRDFAWRYSRGRSTFTAYSGMLVVDGIQGLNRLQRINAFLEALNPGIGPLIYTPEEWQSEYEYTCIREIRKEARPIKYLLNHTLYSA